jgi:hypothetical protein
MLLDDINRLAHPMYIGHQVSAPLPVAVWTDALISALNQSLAVREMSPSFTPLEHQVVAWLTDLVGWDDHAGGTMTSGGTEATFTALLAARSRAVPDVWTNGMPSNAPVVICGEHTHYAVTRAAGELGLGLKRVVVIPSRDYRMDVDALRAAALRAGAPVVSNPTDSTARDLISSLAKGRKLDPTLKRLLRDALDNEDRRDRPRDPAALVSDSARSVSEWIGASPRERGDALVDLLLLADALPLRRRAEQSRFPRLQSAHL